MHCLGALDGEPNETLRSEDFCNPIQAARRYGLVGGSKQVICHLSIFHLSQAGEMTSREMIHGQRTNGQKDKGQMESLLVYSLLEY